MSFQNDNSLVAHSINGAFEDDINVNNEDEKQSNHFEEFSPEKTEKNNFDKNCDNEEERNRRIGTVRSQELPLTDLTKEQLPSLPHPGYNKKDSVISIQGPDSENSSINKESIYINPGFENTSLSNFNMFQRNNSDDPWNNVGEIKKDPSHTSFLRIHEAPSELSIQTGLKFRKTSTFVISPKNSKMTNDKDDMLSIRLLDEPNVPELFIEFDTLYLNELTNNYHWIEKSRWLKFEENYNPDSRRFDSPHLSPLTLRGITNFRKLFSKGEVVLDCHHEKFINVLNNISDSIIKAGEFTEKEITDIRNALILKHFHAGEQMRRTNSEMSMYRFDKENQCFQPHIEIPMSNKRNLIKIDMSPKNATQVKLDRKLEPGTEALSVQVGALKSLEHTFSLFVRLDSPIKANGLNEVNCPLRFIFIVFGPKSREEELLEVGRVFSVMMSNPEFREVGYSANDKEDFIEATKTFVFHSVLVPLNKIITHDSLAAMLPQMKHYFNMFLLEHKQQLYEDMKMEIASKNQEITLTKIDNGVHQEFPINARILSHINLSDSDSTIMKDQTIINNIKSNKQKSHKCHNICDQFFPPFKHFFFDWKGLKLRYISDFRDAFTKDHAPIVFIGMLFIYFVVMAPAITFGALLNAINPMMTVTMMFLASGFFQLFYALFGGQPFEIVGITGPVYAVEKVLGSLAVSMAIELGAMRFWIGVYMALFGIIFTAFNGVVILKHIRRSVEEVYNFLVAAIFILSALFNMFKVLPNTMTPLADNGTNINIIIKERLIFGIGGATLFLSFFMANFCLFLVGIKKSSFLRRQIRNFLGSLNVPLGILLIVVMERVFFHSYSMPTLKVPPSNTVNFSLWFNVPTSDSLRNVSLRAHGLCFAISISLFAILTCEVSTNAILATKSERKLLKPSLYSINYFYILVLFPFISGILGWPFVSGAPVRSHAHCMAMTIWSVNVPGVPCKIIGAVEQRISGIFVGSFVLLSVFFGSVLQYIPMAAMYGMFLYMGIMGAKDLIFIRRLVCMLQRRKYWGSYDYLKDYPTWNIMVLVLIQIFFIAILIMLNCISEFTTISWTPLLFPVTILVYGFIRGFILPKWPRLNTHLSKMDKKHHIKLYADKDFSEHVFVTVDQKGVNLKVMQMNIVEDDKIAMESGSDSENKYW